ncbi:MAG: PKD domain-containing protein [Hadesarchaea archaeon]|nr:PKD domain-containing protein [Hadesarchaea archaeon]
MIWNEDKGIASMSILIIIAVVAAVGVSAFGLSSYLSGKSGEVDSPPNPWITDPSNDSKLYDPTWENIVVSQENVSVRVVNLNSEEDIVSATFEYSINGSVWFAIGTDNNGGFEGFTFSDGFNRKIGDEGWKVNWNLSSLGEGIYKLRAIMTDESGQTGKITRTVHYDPNPPTPIIYSPSYGEEVSGLVEFKVMTDATDVDFATLELFHGSDNWHQQTGIGDLEQGDVGEDGSDGVNRSCAPTAAANALSGQGDNSLYPSGQEDNDLALAEALAKAMGTDKDDGTNGFEKTGGDNFEHRTDSIGSGIESYLESRGVGCSNPEGYEVTYYRSKVRWNSKTKNWYPHSSNVSFDDYNNEIRKGEAVILDIHTWNPGPDGKYGGKDDSVGGGHAITGKGANTTSDAQGNNDITYGDPDDGGSHNGSWEETNGFSRMEYPSGSGNYCIITGIWSISPKNKDLLINYGPISQNPFYTMLDMDQSPENGWVLTWDTTEEEDGFYTLTVRMVDNQKHVSTETIVIQVNNKDEDNQELVASFDFTPENPTIEDVITFTDTSIDPNGQIISWDWDFGDNYHSVLQNPQHQYLDPKNYVVSLTVTDNQGLTDEVSKLIEVIAPTIDNTPPVISGEKPSPESSTTEDTPLIGVDYSDPSGINTSTVKVFVDGDEVTSQATIDSTGVTYTPTTALSEGVHTVEVRVEDNLGNEATASWTFNIEFAGEEWALILGSANDLGKKTTVEKTEVYNEVINWSFEDWDIMPMGWENTTLTPPIYWTQGTDSHTMDLSALMELGPGADGYWHLQEGYRIPANPNVDYILTAYAETDFAVTMDPPIAYVGIQWYNNSGVPVGSASWSSGKEIDDGWTQITLEAKSPSGADSAEVRLRGYNTSTEEGRNLLFDSVEMWHYEYEENPISLENRDAFPAQALQAYWTLKNLGYDDEHIVFMLYHTGDDYISIDDESFNELTDATIDVEDNDVTKSNFEAEITDLASLVTSDDNLLVYIVDHGSQDDSNAYFHFETGDNLSSVEMDALLDQFNFSQLIVMVDSCYSGQFIEDLDDGERILISASGPPGDNLAKYWTGVNPFENIPFAGSWFFHPFWERIETGDSIEAAYNHARDTIPLDYGSYTGMTVDNIQSPRLLPPIDSFFDIYF